MIKFGTAAGEPLSAKILIVTTFDGLRQSF